MPKPGCAIRGLRSSKNASVVTTCGSVCYGSRAVDALGFLRLLRETFGIANGLLGNLRRPFKNAEPYCPPKISLLVFEETAICGSCRRGFFGSVNYIQAFFEDVRVHPLLELALSLRPHGTPRYRSKPRFAKISCALYCKSIIVRRFRVRCRLIELPQTSREVFQY